MPTKMGNSREERNNGDITDILETPRVLERHSFENE